MKLAQLAIGSILFIQAFLLMYSPEEKYNLHSFVKLGNDLFYQVQQRFQDCQYLQNMGFACVESIRLCVVAFLFTGAFSLTLGSNFFVGLLAQLVWAVTQNQVYYSSGLKEIVNTLTQTVFILILVSEVRNDWRKTQRLEKKLERNSHAIAQTEQIGLKLHKESSQSQEKSEHGQAKETKQTAKSEAPTSGKNEKKKKNK